ncbi:hypothetical protein KIH41_01905 [Litoribacter ruber]|uniref:glycine-rich domain-containing protein n=1 Tax=Litoribacter ruber TaxID=702568 RepID=UPI001BD93C7E|nr:hypothetical protein [Litoribacter ruber]MBT0810032.1 hypothetical protein [Litoribacter ruber]
MKVFFKSIFFYFILTAGFAQGQCFREYPISGNFSFNVPFGVTSVTVEVWGAGGKGADMSITGGGGGGGGGAYSRQTLVVIPGQTLSVFVGEGSESVNPGEASWVSLSTNVNNPFVLARGGSSVGLNSPTGAQGGQAALGIGEIRYNGGNGGNQTTTTRPPGNTISPVSGGGGSSGGTFQNGVAGQGPTGGEVEGGGKGGDGSSQGQGSSDGIRGGGGSGGRRQTDNPAQNIAVGGKGGNGYVKISYSCPDADPNWPDCATLIDDGALTGEAIIEFLTGVCEWIPPVGLTEFEVMVVGGGGGGGRGEMAGGGGGGGHIELTFTNINNGQGFGFDVRIPIVVGDGGVGSGDLNNRGGDGGQSSFDLNGSFAVISGGGGGGGSTNESDGSAGTGNGAAGGGASGNGSFGNGDGNNGGIGIINGLDGSGGGGGGAGSAGISGALDAEFVSGGNGGAGVESDFSGIRNIYSAGGGATATLGDLYLSSQGVGGSGVGGVARNVGEGGAGQTPGSGGGAGSLQGGDGRSGIVIVKFQLISITPIEWQNINVTFNNNIRENKIYWSTTKEWENSHFEIERSIDGASGFEVIGNVQGTGWSESLSNYEFVDDRLPLKGGNLLYRLKQVDFNGSFDYSDIISIRVPSATFTQGVWRAYPNPATGTEFQLELLDAQQYRGEEILCRIFSSTTSSGQLAFKDLNELRFGASELIGAITPGLWILEVHWGDKVERIKIVKR